MAKKSNELIIVIVAVLAIGLALYHFGYLSFISSSPTIYFPLYLATYNGTSATPATLYLNSYYANGSLAASTQFTTVGKNNLTAAYQTPYCYTGPGINMVGPTPPQSAFTYYTATGSLGGCAGVGSIQNAEEYINGSTAYVGSQNAYGGTTAAAQGIINIYCGNTCKGGQNKIVILQSIGGVNYTIATYTNVQYAGAAYYYPTFFTLPVLLHVPSVSTVTTVAPTTTGSSSATTTIAIQGAPPTSPPVAVNSGFFSSITSFFSGLFASVTNAIAGLQLNVGFASSGPYYTGSPIPIVVSLSIPAKFQTVPFITGATYVRNTYCAYLVTNTTSVLVESNSTLVSGAFYNTTFTYTPKLATGYGFAAVCQTENDTFSSGSWAGWTAPVVSAQSNITAAVYAPVTTTASTTSSTSASTTVTAGTTMPTTASTSSTTVLTTVTTIPALSVPLYAVDTVLFCMLLTTSFAVFSDALLAFSSACSLPVSQPVVLR